MAILKEQGEGQQPELLAPVADWDMLEAAIHHGADSVYVGMPGYNARARSADFSFNELEAMIRHAHLHGVKVFVAFNILIFQEELENIFEDLQSLLSLAPDALILQDIGLARLVKAMAPSQRIHASTQMSITSSESIELLSDLGLERVVLGREVSMDEISSMRSKTKTELEVFVHGALCVAYSGQCLTSESKGGRSANRGQCAQSCRLPYQLEVDGKIHDLGDQRHLVSPKDLCGLDEVEGLQQAGVNAFKIEGRYKSPEYVATATQAYREALEGASTESRRKKRQELEVSFSRGFFPGWLKGVHHEGLVDGIHSSHIGLEIGEVLRVRAKGGIPWLSIEHHHPLSKGDSLLFTNPEGRPLCGGKIYELQQNSSGPLQVGMARDFPDHELQPNSKVFLNRSPSQDQVIRQGWTDESRKKRHPITLQVSLKEDSPLELKVVEGKTAVTVYSSNPLKPADKRPLDEVTLQRHLGSWGRSPFEVTKWEFQIEGLFFLPAGEIKSLRQEAQKQLEMARVISNPPPLHLQSAKELFRKTISVKSSPIIPKLRVLIREPEQMEELDPNIIDTVILDFKHGVPYRRTIKRGRSLGFNISIATTRILKEDQDRRLNDLLDLEPDEILVRNHGALNFLRKQDRLQQTPWAGDFSLNLCNHMAADYFLEKGLNTWTPSYDLNHQQLLPLLDKVDTSKVEITLHQTIPAFHMEHCVFATFLSDGTTAKDCGMVCRDHRVSLIDDAGIAHPLQADQECRNTMFNGVPQSVASTVPNLMSLGVGAFRIEALTETPEDLASKVKGYHDLLHHKIEASDLLTLLGGQERFGVSEGQFTREDDYQPFKK